MTPTEIVQAQLDAYNAQAIDAFMACFAEDAVLADLNGAVTEAGAPAIRARYAALFGAHPNNHARLVKRIAVGAVVIDHEDIARGPDGPSFRAAAIYTVQAGRIVRVDFVREG